MQCIDLTEEFLEDAYGSAPWWERARELYKVLPTTHWRLVPQSAEDVSITCTSEAILPSGILHWIFDQG